MQAPMQRPTNPEFIANEGTNDEMWWNETTQAWVKAPARQPKLDEIVQAFSAIRDARAARKRIFEEQDALLEADQQILKAAMLGIMNATGAQSVKTEAGTAYRSLKVKPSVADWSAVYDWIAEDPDRFEIMEKRVKSTFVADFMEANEGRAPPGVNVHREYEVTVRRANASAK